MRIFYAADTTPNATFESNLWRYNLCTPLIDMGHEVVEFDYDLRDIFLNLDPSYPDQRRFIEKTRPVTSRKLLRQLRAAHAAKPIDLFFSYFYDACVLPSAIDEIRELGITTINWYCNASYQLHLISEIAPHYDWCLVPERFRLADYAALGARPLYCQMAANPAIYKPHDVPVEFDATFVGQAYGERPAYVRHLLDEGIDIRVWGPGWIGLSPAAEAKRRAAPRRAGELARRLLTARGLKAAFRRLGRLGPGRGAHAAPGGGQAALEIEERAVGDTLSDIEMIRMYSRSKINLGFSAVVDTHKGGERIVQVRLRDFEVPMSGGFYMVEYMPEIEEFYEVGREIVCYADRRELADKIRYYLAHDGEREAIRRAGHERALRDHTWQKRFEEVFRTIGAPA